VEDEMSKGNEFESAYQTALQRVCPNGLDEIQNKTEFLLNSQGRKILGRMMYISGFATLTGILVTVIRKILHLPFVDLLLTASVFVAVFFFFPVLYIRLLTPKSKKTLDRMMYISGFVALTVLLITVIMKMLHIPGAGLMTLITAFFAVFFFFPALFISLFKQTSGKKKISFIFGFTGAWLLALSAMFFLLHWPGMSLIPFVAVVCIYIAVFPLFFYKTFKKTR